MAPLWRHCNTKFWCRPRRGGASARPSITVFTDPLEIDAGYEQAVPWAQQFGLPREPLDRWHARAKTEKPPDISGAGRSIDNHRFLGPEGPVPTVEVHTSFNDERPVVTSVQFF